MAIWITGSNGLIGGHLLKAMQREGMVVIDRPRKDLDLGDFTEVRRFFRETRPQGVIHCAAISKAADCEKDPVQARRINVELTRLLGELSCDIPLIFLSTDLVFDGAKGDYTESDSPAPLNFYGETKALAEEFVLKNPKHTVVRTSLNAGISPRGNRAFNEEMKRACKAGNAVKLFEDEFRSPIPVEETARLLCALLERQANGLFHLAGGEILSRFEIGLALLEKWGLPRDLAISSSLRDYQGPPRAANTTLNCDKLKNLLQVSMPRFRQWITCASESQI